MRKRPHEKHFFFNDAELEDLTTKAKNTGLSEAALIRMLLRGYAPKEKPDERFYTVMRELSAIGNNINQLARKAATLGFIDIPFYKREAEEWNAFRIAVKKEFLEPERIKPNDGCH